LAEGAFAVVPRKDVDSAGLQVSKEQCSHDIVSVTLDTSLVYHIVEQVRSTGAGKDLESMKVTDE